MRKTRTGQFIRGGQTTQHWFRMAFQVLKYAGIVGLFSCLLTYSLLVWRSYELEKVQTSYYWLIARFAVENRADPDQPIHLLTLQGTRETWPARRVYRDPEIAALYARYEANAVRFLYLSLPVGAIAAFLTIGVFWWSGRGLGKDEFIRGSRLVSKKELIAWSKAKWREDNKRAKRSRSFVSPFNIGRVPFPPKTVEAQTGIFGTVGVGKTTAFKDLMTSIRAEGARAVIYDNTGSFVSEFYDPERDVIINPFDARSHAWSPFGEATSPESFAQIAEVMVPTRPGERDPFWSNTARLVFEYVARRLQKDGKTTNADLRRAIMELPADKLQELLASSPGAHFVNPKMDKTAANIRANMITELRFLEFLRDDGAPFSIRDWVKQHDGRGGFVFLTGDAEHAAATRNIISTLLEVASNALMTEEECFEPRLWFVIDELPSLNRMPFIVNHLAQVRKYGGAYVLGWQVYSQIEDVYGEKGAQSILGNVNNRVIFNTPDARTAQVFSDNLGKTDLVETRENLTLGAHSARDGVGMLAGRAERALASPSEIQALPQFICFLRFAYDAPAARIELEPGKDAENPRPKFVKYIGSGFAHGAMDPETGLGSDPSTRPAPSPELQEAQLRAFETWFTKFRRDIELDPRDPYKIPDTLAERQHLWRHFVGERRKGVPSAEIGRPRPEPVGLVGNHPVKTPPVELPILPPYPVELATELGLLPGTDPKPVRIPAEKTEPSKGRQLELGLSSPKSAAPDAGKSDAPKGWDIGKLGDEEPLTHLPLSAGEIDALTAAGCNTVGTFRALEPADIMALVGLSPARKATLLAALAGNRGRDGPDSAVAVQPSDTAPSPPPDVQDKVVGTSSLSATRLLRSSR